jgi:hypothetical protein
MNKPGKAILLTYCLAFTLPSFAYPAESGSQPDTVIVRTETGEEVVIITNEPAESELDLLQSLNLNAIISDLRSTTDSLGRPVQVEIRDENGLMYRTSEDMSFDERMEAFEQRMEAFSERMEAQTEAMIEEREDEKKEGTKQNLDEEEGVAFNNPNTRVEGRYLGTSFTAVFDFGVNNYMNTDGGFPDETNEPYTVKPFGSWYVALGGLYSTHVGGPLFLEWGGNVSWYNFKFQNEDVVARKNNDPGRVTFETDPRDVRAIKSKIVAPYLNLSIVPTLDFSKNIKNRDGMFKDSYSNRGFNIGAGVYAGYRIGGRSKFVFEEEGNRQREKNRNNLFLNNWRYGVRAQIGFRGVDLFFNYDLNKLFANGRGPALNAFSFGFTF